MTIANVLIPLLQVASATPPLSPYARAGRHGLELGIGLLDQARGTVSVTAGGTTTTSGNGVGGSLTYTYWVADNLGLAARVGAVDVDASVTVDGSGSDVRSASIVSLLFGVKYQPFKFRGTDRLRPYVAAAVGPYIGNDAGVHAGGGTTSVASRTEVAPGGRAGIGLDFLASRRVMLGVGLGYHLMTDFNQAVGADRNYSGADFSIAVGLLLGGGR